MLKLFCPKRFDQFAYIPSQGASGGLLTIWNSSIFSGDIIISEQFALGVNFKSTQSAHKWSLINIYGPCQGEHRETFTKWLFDLDLPSSKDWLLLGD